MRLLALELQGFKSFPDRTRLEFDDGITAVVGPNGSGKSNIADAMRWAMGEQSTKTLRGSLMEDVIFNGTQERKPVGYAMVRLTLDNHLGKLEGFGDEVTIARRLYRSGESEYSIDGEQVRMRDVHELFMDTGLGRDGYSIIGQGKISEIVSAKSGERREIFEEAAGIAKYRYRRTDAQRRLGAAEENLVRLLDILTELEERVEPLREQSEKAKKYLLFAEERKKLEISLWVLQLDELKKNLAEQENKVMISKNDYEKLEAASEKLEEQLLSTHQRMTELSAAAEERRRLIRSLEEQSSQEKSQIAVLENDIHHNQLAIDRIIDELSGADATEQEMREQFSVQEQALTAAVTAVEHSKESLLALENHHTEEKQREIDLQEQIRNLQENKTTLEQGVGQLKLEQATSATRIVEGRSRLQETKTNRSAHDAAVVEYRENVEECQTQMGEQEQALARLEEERQVILADRSAKTAELTELQSGYQTIADEVSQKRSRVKLLQELESNMEGFAGSVRYIVRQQEKEKLIGIVGTVSSIIQTEQEYTTAIETALGGSLQNIVVEDENAAKAAMESLKHARAGRATFLPLTSVKGTEYNFSAAAKQKGFIGSAANLVKADSRFQGIILQLLGRVCIVDTLDNGTTIAKANGFRFRIVTLDGQVINAGGSFTGGSSARSGGILGRKAEIEQLIRDGKDLRKEAERLEPAIREKTEEIESIDKKLSAKGEEIQLQQDENIRLRVTLEQLERSLTGAIESQSIAKRELDSLEERLSQIEKGEEDSTHQLEESGTELESMSLSLQELLKLQQNQVELLATLQQNLADLRMEEYAGRSKLENQKAELARLGEQIDFADSNRERLAQDKQNLERGNTQIAQRAKELTASTENIANEMSLNNKSITEFMEQRTTLEQGTTELRKQERELSSQREEVSRELVRLEERTHTVQARYDGIIAKLWEEYELTRSRAIEESEVLENPEDSQRRLGELRTRIRALGSVNVDAIEEYKDVFERYTFLSEQLKDVEGAKNQLLGLIDELTEEMQVLFIDTFEQINHEFSITFRELFGGGKAQLILTDDDVLEAGIEIHVQPPGKVIKNLSLLSGGEQSFVAIAIYFAILKVKPAPFVMLDEIEAALDDVNVVRFANYLRTMSGNTQFIAITHRRGTMEEADVLYGVTMQEEGVSKLLELNIQEVENKLGMEATD